jgi:hypothetical protein
MRWTKIDETTRPDHYYLAEPDQVYHLREYSVRKGWSCGETNQLIYNLKISPSEIAANPKRQYWKDQAIARCASDIRSSLSRELVERVTWVPVPPSSVVGDPDYDDRLVRVLRQAFAGYNADIRELMRQTVTTAPDHKAGDRTSYDELLEILAVDRHLLAQRQPGDRFILFDDVLTTGKHLKCCEARLREELPFGPAVVGMYIARSIRPSPFEDFEDLDA